MRPTSPDPDLGSDPRFRDSRRQAVARLGVEGFIHAAIERAGLSPVDPGGTRALGLAPDALRDRGHDELQADVAAVDRRKGPLI